MHAEGCSWVLAGESAPSEMRFKVHGCYSRTRYEGDKGTLSSDCPHELKFINSKYESAGSDLRDNPRNITHFAASWPNVST